MEEQRKQYHHAIREHLRSSYLLSEEKIEAVLPRFLDTVAQLMSELEHICTTDDTTAISRTGHAMKGALLNLGLHDLAQKAYNIEKNQENNGTEQDCAQLIGELKQEIIKIL
jgi:HPt (histidine-containing phosphotransfer) domain-containing protein